MFRTTNQSAVPMILRSPEGDTGSAGGSGGSGAGGSGEGDPASKQVPLDTYKKALDQVHETKNQLKSVSDQMTALQTELNTLKTKGKESSGDYKGLYEQKNQEFETLKQTHDGFKKSVFNNERMRSLENELKTRGLKEGSESIIDFADLEKMPYEVTSRGRILVNGVKEIANDLESKYSFAFSKTPAPKINSGGGSGGTEEVNGEELTAEYMTKLEVTDKAKYKELFPKYLEQYRKRNAK